MGTGLADALSRVFWIGGSPCAGKSTVGRMIADKHCFTLYSCDDHLFTHLRKCDGREHPQMHRYSRLSWKERWMRPTDVQLDEMISFFREEMALILDDIARFETARPLLVEGAALLPCAIRELGVDPGRIVYLVAPEDVRIARHARRPGWERFIEGCAEPEKAIANWAARDAGFNRFVSREARRRGMTVICTDGRSLIEKVLQKIEVLFGLGFTGSNAESGLSYS